LAQVVPVYPEVAIMEQSTVLHESWQQHVVSLFSSPVCVGTSPLPARAAINLSHCNVGDDTVGEIVSMLHSIRVVAVKGKRGIHATQAAGTRDLRVLVLRRNLCLPCATAQ
jgi:hypothetical protein